MIMKPKALAITFILLIIIGISIALSFYFFYSKQARSSRGGTTIEPYAGSPRIVEKSTLLPVKLLFSSPDQAYLVPEERKIMTGTKITDQCVDVIIELIKGPHNENLLATIPKDTKLKSLFFASDGSAYIDFSNELVANHIGGTEEEMLTVYSIINTLTLNFPAIKKVQILVNEKQRDTLNGHLYTGIPLTFNHKIMSP
jgi:spore germination protein GerM